MARTPRLGWILLNKSPNAPLWHNPQLPELFKIPEGTCWANYGLKYAHQLFYDHSFYLESSFQNLEVNWTPLSDTILLGTPWSLITSLRKILAVSEAEGVPIMGKKWAILERRSTTTRMVVNPSEAGKSTMKSMDTSAHGRSGMGKGLSSPQDLVFWPLLHWQRGQEESNPYNLVSTLATRRNERSIQPFFLSQSDLPINGCDKSWEPKAVCHVVQKFFPGSKVDHHVSLRYVFLSQSSDWMETWWLLSLLGWGQRSFVMKG